MFMDAPFNSNTTIFDDFSTPKDVKAALENCGFGIIYYCIAD